MTRLEMGIKLNKLVMLMDDASLERCKDTLKELESAIEEMFEKCEDDRK